MLNNCNVCYDCCNNFDNCTFELISDEITDISYIKKYYNLFDKSVSNFLNSDSVKAEIEKAYNEILLNVKHDNHFIDAKISSLKSKRLENLETAKWLKKRGKKT